ncbi:MAG TPA: YggT family protein [Usitatibacter sp.]|jgi:YggT family protein|nr:YggT family protein [Usitatibacter sp.]
MIAQAIAFVVDAIASLFILAALLRFWMQALRAPSRNPIAYFSMALTDFAVKPLRRVVPGMFKLDMASLLVALLFEFVLQVILWMLAGGSPVENPGALSVVLFFSFVKLIRLTIYIFMGAIIIQAVLSWVSPYHPVAPFFDALAKPLLRPVQKAIPPIGGVDITPVFVLIFLQLLLMLPVTWLEMESARMLSRALL